MDAAPRSEAANPASSLAANLRALHVPRRLRPLVRSLIEEAVVRSGGRLVDLPDGIGLAAPPGHPALSRTAEALRDMAAFPVELGDAPAPAAASPRTLGSDGPVRRVVFARAGAPVAQYLAVALPPDLEPEAALPVREDGAARLLGLLATGGALPRLDPGLPLLLDMPVARFRGEPRRAEGTAPVAVLPLAALSDPALPGRIAAWRVAGWRMAWRGPGAALAWLDAAALPADRLVLEDDTALPPGPLPPIALLAGTDPVIRARIAAEGGWEAA